MVHYSEMDSSVRVACREEDSVHVDPNFIIKYKFHFMKRGPEPNEFCDSLASKMDSLIETIGLSEAEQKSVDKTKKRAISMVKQRVCIRQNISDPTRVDRRRSANQLHADRGVLRNPNESPQKAAKDSSGRRGIVKFTKTTHTNYKAKQETLLAYLERFSDNTETEGYDPHSNTEVFSNYIDHHTLSIIRLLLVNGVKNLTSAKLEQLRIMLDLCEHVVMGRVVIDWAQPNNFMTQSGWDNWRNHMYVLISFAAMLTVLFMVFTMLKGSHTVITYGFHVGIFPVVLLSNFINRHCCITCNLIKPNTATMFCTVINPNNIFAHQILNKL